MNGFGGKETIFLLASYVNTHCLQVERLPLPGESLGAGARWTEHGGKGLNVGLGAHRLGAKVEMLLTLGADSIAESVLQFLQAETSEFMHANAKSLAVLNSIKYNMREGLRLEAHCWHLRVGATPWSRRLTTSSSG